MRLELEITHRCNKNCKLCDHRIAGSDYDYLTAEQYYQIKDAMSPGDFERVLLIGGEPLMHPDFPGLAWRVLGDFDRVQVATNGSYLILGVKPDVFSQLEWIIQEYPGWNDEVVAKFGGWSNVTVRPHREFVNPYDSPGLDEATARRVADSCLHQVRLVGTRLYRCCLSEGVERYYQTGPVHVEFSENWRQDWEALPVWKACAHCFRARENLRWGDTVQVEGLDDANQRALVLLDNWNAMVDLVQDHTRYHRELQSLMEDAVECGAQAAMRIQGLLPSERATKAAREAAEAAEMERRRSQWPFW